MGNDGFQNVPPGPLEVIGADTSPAALPILWGMGGTCGVVEGFQWEGTPNGHVPWAPGEVRKEKGVTTTSIFLYRLLGMGPQTGVQERSSVATTPGEPVPRSGAG